MRFPPCNNVDWFYIIVLGILFLYVVDIVQKLMAGSSRVRRIRKHLAAQGATLLTIATVEEPSLSDRDNHTSLYLITYRDRNGWVHSAQCITAFGDSVFFSNDTVLPGEDSAKV